MALMIDIGKDLFRAKRRIPFARVMHFRTQRA
jgi:hypothetical protein